MATTKLHSLRQGFHPVLVCIADFYQLACDIDWNDNSLIGTFYWGLRDDIEDLLLNLLDPLTLTEAITQVVQCDN